jgi:LPS-assembly lipoprotein
MGLTAVMRCIPLLACLLFLSACGFTPLYGQHKAAQSLAQVQIADMADRSGQQMRLLLSDRFYGAQAPSPARWRLDVVLTSSRDDLGIRRDDVATRARLNMYATFTLTPVGGDKPAITGRERSFVSYNIFTDPYATSAAQDNAQERGLTQLADLITNRVALYLSGNSPSSSGAVGPTK